MLKDKWFRIGLAGSILAALCCFTPLAVIAVAAIGLGAYAIWLDLIIMPALIVFLGILIAAIIRLRQGAS